MSLTEELKAALREEISKGFDQWFSADVLQGRPRLLADITSRTYPYGDLTSAYAAGVSVAADVFIKWQKAQEDNVGE